MFAVKDLNVCLLPMDIKWEDKDENLKNIEMLFEKVHPDTDLVILPETFSTGFPSGRDKEYVREMAERNTGRTIDIIKNLAHRYNMAVAGSFIADTGGSLYNRGFFIEPSGEETFGDKHHLFTMAGENKVFSRGHGKLEARFRGWNLSIVICYDVRFPVWCRNVGNSYDALIAVANWPVVRVDAWNQLLRARAIENEAYVCGVNCKGTDTHGFEYDGSSAVIDFKGKNIDVRSDKDFHYAVLSYEKLVRFREKFPAWKDADSFIISD